MVVIGERERANLVVQTARFFSLRPTKRRVSAHARLRDALFFTGNCTFLNFTHAQNVIVFILKIASRHGKSILHWAQMANCLTLSHSVAGISALFCVSERTVWPNFDRQVMLNRNTGSSYVWAKEDACRTWATDIAASNTRKSWYISTYMKSKQSWRFCLELV